MSSLTGQEDLIKNFSDKLNLNINIELLTIENLLILFFIIIFIKISLLIFIIYYQNNFVFTFLHFNKLFQIICKEICYFILKIIVLNL